MQFRASFALVLSCLCVSASCQGDAGDPEAVSSGGQGGAEDSGGSGGDSIVVGGQGDGAPMIVDAGGSGGSGGSGGMIKVDAAAGGSAAIGGAGGMMAAGGNNAIGGTAGTTMVNDDPPAGWVRAAIAIGYAGQRAVTRDYGATWADKTQLAASGGDDDNLLRGVAFGRGKWVAVGWKHLVSDDGANWTVVQRKNSCGLMEDIAYGNGVFLGTCGESAHTSTDGINFSAGSRIGGTGGHTYVWFAKGLFVSSGDSGASFSSPDGKKWAAMPQRRVSFCEDEFRTEGECGGAAWAEGHYVRERYPLGFQRSTDGKNWQAAGPGRGTYRIRFGYAPPK